MSVVHEVFIPAARVGLKGREVSNWLARAGFEIPKPNAYTRLGNGGRCLRLGNGEYLLAHDDDAAAFDALLASPVPPRVHPLLRSDRCVRLRGPDATARLLQVCDFDDRALSRQPGALALLAVADVPVVLHAESRDGTDWRLWCDPTWVEHLDHCFSRTSPTAPRLP